MIWRLSHLKLVARVASRVETDVARRDLQKFVAGIAKEAPADEPVLTDPELEPMFEAEMEQALLHGGVGVLDDMWAFLDWGFRPEEISQHCELFYGDSDQILSPEMYRGLGERLPDRRQHVWEGGGHYAVFAHWEQFLGSLA
jgi:pimeloyl-ACP methyl ester carboxylesterase